MARNPYIDRYDYHYRLTSCHADHTVDTNHSSGHEIRRQAELLSDQFAYHTGVWCPGFASYMVAEPGTRTVRLPRNVPCSECDLPDVLVAGKRQVSGEAPQDSLQPAANVDIEVRMSENDGSERSSLRELYELSADADHARLLKVVDGDSESPTTSPSTPFVRDKSKHSSLLPNFGYLEPLITSTSPVSDPAPQVENADDFAYIGRYIITRESSLPASAPSSTLPAEDFSYLGKLIEVGYEPALPQSWSPTSPDLSALSLSSTQLDVSLTLSTAPSFPIIATGSSIATTTTPAAAPPLSPKYGQYLDLQYQNVPPDYSHESYPSESSGAAQTCPCDHMEPGPPPLPPKPEQYRPRTCRSPIDYEASVEAKYHRGVSQRLRARPERLRRYDEEGRTLHVVNQDVPGWTYSSEG